MRRKRSEKRRSGTPPWAAKVAHSPDRIPPPIPIRPILMDRLGESLLPLREGVSICPSAPLLLGLHMGGMRGHSCYERGIRMCSCARLFRLWLLLLVASPWLPASASAVVTIDWVTVGDPGNGCDTQSQGCFGAVAYEYRIGKYEVTNAQYTEFLNAVAGTDTNELYNTSMGFPAQLGGITRTGGPGSWVYSAIAGREELPVNWVTFWDVTRFVNWLHNGQPAGAQGSATTEDGAYTLTPTAIENLSVTRNAGARVFVASEDEWYKAAYYSPVGMAYFDYPAGSDTQIVCTVPGATSNAANCDSIVGDLTSVGSYTGAASPSGTFDQGGNIWERTESDSPCLNCVLRGGYYFHYPTNLAASFQAYTAQVLDFKEVGFRVASPVPALPVPSLSPLGMGLSLCTLGAVGLRRFRSSPSSP